MKKLKEVTDKKKTSLLTTIDAKLTEAAGELGLSLEQRTVRMKQRDKKVRVPPVSLCFAVSGWGVAFPSPLLLACTFSPPLLRRAAPASRGAGLEASCGRGGRGTGPPRGGRRAQARPAQFFSHLALPVAHFISEEWLCTSRLLTLLYIIKNIYVM